MIQNLKYSCRQGIEALTDKQCTIGCIPSYLRTYYCLECK